MWKVALVAWLQAAVAITLPAVRGLLQQRYSSRSDVVTSMDMDLSGIITNEEFRRFATRDVSTDRGLGLTDAEAEELLMLLCQQQQRLSPRQIDALSFDLQLPGLRLLLRAEYGTTGELMAFLDGNGDAEISLAEWSTGLQLKQITMQNAMDLFLALDPGSFGALSSESLRLVVSETLSLCDYRELLRQELGEFNSSLAAADVNADFKVLPEELLAQALPYCISESNALQLHKELDVLSQGFIDLFAFSSTRIPQMLQRETLTSYRACLRSYFPNELAAVQDLAVLAAGFPANLRALSQQGSAVAWQTALTMERLFVRLDPLSTGQLPRRRFESLVGTVTLSGLRMLLGEVAPGGQSDLLSRADIDQGGSLSLSEFMILGNLLGLADTNAISLFELLNYTGAELDAAPLQTILGEVTVVHFRLLVLSDFAVDPFPVVDQDVSDVVEAQEFQSFGGMLAVHNSSNTMELFQILDVSRRGLRPAQLALLSSTVLDIPLLRQLLRAELSQAEAGHFLNLIDSSGNGLIELQEFETWMLHRLALPASSVAEAFKALDLCQGSQLHAEQLMLLIETPSVVVLRALLASRYPQQEYAILTADNDDDDLISPQEFGLFMQDLFIGSSDASVLFQQLDTNQDGFLGRSELTVATAQELKLFDFRRLVAWSFSTAEESFNLADANGNDLVSQQELQHLGCRRLALKGNVTSEGVFRVVDLATTGEVALEELSLALGEVQVNGFRALVQAVFSAGVEAFLISDLNGDHLLQRDEFHALATALAVSSSNAESLFQSLATRRSDVIHQDVFLLAVNGLGQFRVLLRESYSDQRSALLDFDTMQPWNEVTLQEFAAWCDRLQLPNASVPELFEDLDARREQKLGPWHFEMLLSGEISARAFGQLLVSAFRQLPAAFQKADSEGDGNNLVSLVELTRLAASLGISSPNVAKLFAELDVDQVGYLSLAQFEVMASPGSAFRLSNAQAELDPIHMFEMHLYGDHECTWTIPCELPMASGNFQASGNASNASDFTVGRAVDGSFSSRWVSQCGPCREEVAWIGCKNDGPMEIRCLKLYQTAPRAVLELNRTAPVSSVAAALRMQTWNGKAWVTITDILKPPLFEIDNFGEPLIFKMPGSSTTRLMPDGEQQTEQDDFEARFGISLPILVLISLGVGICGLLCLCVLCPILARPSCLNALRVNAPERMDAKRSKKLDKIIQMKREVREMEAAVTAGATTTDEWGMSHKVQHSEQKARERQLDQMRKSHAKMEYSAMAGGGREMPTEERIQKRKAEMERYRRMKEAYESKTIAVDGVALQAPESVLMELGFDQEMIEAFGLPGFSSADQAVDAQDEDEDLKDDSEDSDDQEEQEEESEDDDEPQHAATPSKFDDGRVTVPAQLDEAPALFKEGARLRRNAMASMEEGQPMDPDELKRAQRIAAMLKGTELKEDDDVEKWMSQRKNDKTNKVVDLENVELDQEAMQKEKKREARMFNVEKRRLRALTGDVKQEDSDGSEEDMDAQLARAAAPQEKVTMNIFQETPAQDEPIRVTVRGEKDLTARPGIGRGKTSELGRSKTAQMERGKSSELGRGKTAEMERDKTSELGRGKTSQMERGKSSGEVARSKFGEGVASSKSKDLSRSGEAALAAAQAVAEAVEAVELDMALAAEEPPPAPEPYDGEVYRGMPVRPRGLGTPRRDMLAGEVYRSSLDAPLSEMGDGLQWGRFSKAKPHFRAPEDREQKVIQVGFFSRMMGARAAPATPALPLEVPPPEAAAAPAPQGRLGRLGRRLLRWVPRLRRATANTRPPKRRWVRWPKWPKVFRRKAKQGDGSGSAPGTSSP